MHELPRVLYIDNFRLFPSTEEHIDFVDQTGFLFGPTVAATINHITSLLYWWNEESKLLDVESAYDCTTYVCNKLIPTLMKYRNAELLERRRKIERENELARKNKTGEIKNIMMTYAEFKARFRQQPECRDSQTSTTPQRKLIYCLSYKVSNGVVVLADEELDGEPIDSTEQSQEDQPSGGNVEETASSDATFNLHSPPPYTQQDAEEPQRHVSTAPEPEPNSDMEEGN